LPDALRLEFLFAGRLEVDYLNQKYNLMLPESELFTTLAGLIFNHLEDIPNVKEQFTIGNYKLTVEQVSGNKIEQVRLIILDNTET